MKRKRQYIKKINRIKSAYERMMRRVIIPNNKDDCWLWCGPVNNAGYGMIRGDSGIPKMITVHRVAGKEKGLDIENNEIQHTCLTKHCVNPNHLTIGVPKDRQRRVIAKYGRNFQKPKEPYKLCTHCMKKTYVTWFSRKHSDCYTYIPKNKV